MGVPISYLQKHNPEQFHLVGTEKCAEDLYLTNRNGRAYRKDRACLRGKYLFARIFIQAVSPAPRQPKKRTSSLFLPREEKFPLTNSQKPKTKAQTNPK